MIAGRVPFKDDPSTDVRCRFVTLMPGEKTLFFETLCTHIPADNRNALNPLLPDEVAHVPAVRPILRNEATLERGGQSAVKKRLERPLGVHLIIDMEDIDKAGARQLLL